MHSITINLSQLNDAALLAAILNNVQDNRAALLQLLRYLGEVDARKLYARQGHASLFVFCQKLGFSESEAYKRCLVGRAGRRFPELLAAMGAGALHLTGAAMIAPKMNGDNAAELLDAAKQKSKRELETVLANMFPAACVPRRAVIRAVSVLGASPTGTSPTGAHLGTSTQPPLSRARDGEAKDGAQRPRATLQTELLIMPARGSTKGPLAEERAVSADQADQPGRVTATVAAEAYRLHVNLDSAGYALLREAQELLSHKLPSGDVGKVIELALGSLVDQLQRRKHGRLKKAQAPRNVVQKSASIDDSKTTLGRNEKCDGAGGVESPAHEVRVAESASPKTRTGRSAQTETAGRSRALSRLVKRKVYERDAGSCTYVGANGRRCGSRAFLEYHHIHAFGLGGCNDEANVTLHCRTHNALLALEDFGEAHQARATARGRKVGVLCGDRP